MIPDISIQQIDHTIHLLRKKGVQGVLSWDAPDQDKTYVHPQNQSIDNLRPPSSVKVLFPAPKAWPRKNIKRFSK